MRSLISKEIYVTIIVLQWRATISHSIKITYCPFLSAYISYRSSGEKLLKYQEN